MDECTDALATVEAGDFATESRSDADGLPMRDAARCLAIGKVRLMNDPEVLERVLAGLLNLP